MSVIWGIGRKCQIFGGWEAITNMDNRGEVNCFCNILGKRHYTLRQQQQKYMVQDPIRGITEVKENVLVTN